MISLLIFDYDGVLFDTTEIAYSLVSKECGKYCRAPIRTKAEFAEIYNSNFYDAMKKRGVSRENMEKLKKESIKILSGKRLRPHKGIIAAVRKLSKGHTLAVVSSNYDSIMRKNLKIAGILDEFKFIMGAEEGESKMQKIKSLLKSAKAKKSEAVFITDTVGDIKEAKKAGVMTMGVVWGFHSKAMLAKSKPDYIAEKPECIMEEMA